MLLSLGNVVKLAGIVPVKLLSFKTKSVNDVKFANAGEIVPENPHTTIAKKVTSPKLKISYKRQQTAS